MSLGSVCEVLFYKDLSLVGPWKGLPVTRLSCWQVFGSGDIALTLKLYSVLQVRVEVRPRGHMPFDGSAVKGE